MMFRLAFLLLGPLLYLQGQVVRRTTPRLPEAAGARSGWHGEGVAIRLLIAGDSAAAGVGVERQSQALAGRLAAALSGRHAVSWTLLAETGQTAAQLCAKLQSCPAEAFDVAVVSVGVNDVTALTRSQRWTEQLRTSITLLQQRLQVRLILLSGLPPMHRFPALPQPLRWWLGLRARHFNALMRQLAATTPGCQFVDIPYPADRAYVAADGFHPGEPAYQLWAEQVSAAILAAPVIDALQQAA